MIKRYLHGSSPAWRVHKGGECRTFHDISHGGTEAAHEAARIWADSVRPTPKNGFVLSKPRRGNPAEVAGVCPHKGNKGWRARWTGSDGKQRSKVFSVSSYGDGALEAAIEFRKVIVAGRFSVGPAAREVIA